MMNTDFENGEYVKDAHFKNDPASLYKHILQIHPCGSSFLLWLSEMEKQQINFLYHELSCSP